MAVKEPGERGTPRSILIVGTGILWLCPGIVIGAAVGLYYAMTPWRPFHWGSAAIGMPLPEATALLAPVLFHLTNRYTSALPVAAWWITAFGAVWALYVGAFWALARIWFREVRFTAIVARLWWSCLPYLVVVISLHYSLTSRGGEPFLLREWLQGRLAEPEPGIGSSALLSLAVGAAALIAAVVQLTGLRRLYKAKWPGAVVLAGICAALAGVATWGLVVGIRRLVGILGGV